MRCVSNVGGKERGNRSSVGMKGLLTIANAWLRVEREADDVASAFVKVSSLAFCCPKLAASRTELNFVVGLYLLISLQGSLRHQSHITFTKHAKLAGESRRHPCGQQRTLHGYSEW